MLEKSDIKEGDTVWLAQLAFSRKTFRCVLNTPPTKCYVCKHTGVMTTSLYLIDYEDRFADPMTTNAIYIIGEYNNCFPELYSTEEEAVEEYNKRIMNEMDRLESMYEKAKKSLDKKLVKK